MHFETTHGPFSSMWTKWKEDEVIPSIAINVLNLTILNGTLGQNSPDSFIQVVTFTFSEIMEV